MATQINGLILPEHADILQLYLIRSKDESTYLTNAQIADMICSAFDDIDAEDIAHQVLENLKH